MQCNCGNETTVGTHEVKTQKFINQWIGTDNPNPIKIHSETCGACGRSFVKIYDTITNELLKQRG